MVLLSRERISIFRFDYFVRIWKMIIWSAVKTKLVTCTYITPCRRLPSSSGTIRKRSWARWSRTIFSPQQCFKSIFNRLYRYITRTYVVTPYEYDKHPVRNTIRSVTRGIYLFFGYDFHGFFVFQATGHGLEDLTHYI
jgi:hypothetical protein